MKRKILVIGMGTSTFGLEKQTVEAFRFMNDVEPHFLISKYEDGSVSKILKDNGFKFEHVPTGYIGRYNLVWTLITVVQIPVLYFKIFKAFFKNNCKSVLILNTQPIINALLPFLALKIFKNVPVVFYFHNVFFGKKHYKAVSVFIYKIVNYLASKVVAVSCSIKNELLENGIKSDKLIVVYNGIDLDKYSIRKNTKTILKLNLNTNHFIVGFCGQLNYEKGIFDFIDAANKILEDDEKFTFIIMGKKNNNYKNLQNYICKLGIKNNIIFTDWVTNVEDYYSLFDVLIVPSLMSEGLPLVNIEAMACGVPAITTKMGGLKETIVEEKTGFFIENNNPDQISQKVLELYKNRELAKEMRKNARTRVEKHFDIKKNAKKIEEILMS